MPFLGFDLVTYVYDEIKKKTNLKTKSYYHANPLATDDRM